MKAIEISRGRTTAVCRERNQGDRIIIAIEKMIKWFISLRKLEN